MNIGEIKTIIVKGKYEENDVFFGFPPELYVVMGYCNHNLTIKRVC